MSPTASTVIALASLALAAFTVLVNFLNVRRQAEAAMKAEQVKWLRDKRDDLYGTILSVVDTSKWHPPPVGFVDWRCRELGEARFLARRYASDAVLSATEDLGNVLANSVRAEGGDPPITAEEFRLREGLEGHIRDEIAGHDEAKKTWRRWTRNRSRTAFR